MPNLPPILACAAALMLALAPAAAAAQTPLYPKDEDAIHQSVLLLIDQTNNDPMATLAAYAQSDRVTSVNGETIATGWDALVNQTRAQVRAQPPGAFTVQPGKLDIVGMGPDHALVVAPLTMFHRVNGSVVSVSGSMTLAYERTDGGWKIIHEHYSEGLDEQTRMRLSQGAGRVTGADLLRLLLIGVGGTPTRLLNAMTEMLASRGCTAR